MNSQLIPVFNGTISSESQLLCNARDLHQFLDVGKDFSTWIRERISEYEFVANLDYMVFSPNLGKSIGRPKKEYHLTLDTAKELAMVERNDKGRQVRRYFIECEKKLHSTPTPAPEVKTHTLTLTDEELCSLCWLWLAATHMREKIELVYPVLKTLKSDYTASFYSMAFEYRDALNDAKQILVRETKFLELHPHRPVDDNWRRVLPRLRH